MLAKPRWRSGAATRDENLEAEDFTAHAAHEAYVYNCFMKLAGHRCDKCKPLEKYANTTCSIN